MKQIRKQKPQILVAYIIESRTPFSHLNLNIMKRINLYGLLIFGTTVLIISGCTEETLSIAPPLPPVITGPPISYAGGDIIVLLPTDFFWLSGTYSDTGAVKIYNILWKKISGPSSYILENPNSLRTKVSKLEKGIYEFELSVTNQRGLIGKDIVRVTVSEIPENNDEITLKDMAWVCPMGCHIEIKNIYSHLPAGSVFQIYIQRDNSANWEEVINDESSQLPEGVKYTYKLYNGNLYIFTYNNSDEQTDTPNIKIVYSNSFLW